MGWSGHRLFVVLVSAVLIPGAAGSTRALERGEGGNPPPEIKQEIEKLRSADNNVHVEGAEALRAMGEKAVPYLINLLKTRPESPGTPPRPGPGGNLFAGSMRSTQHLPYLAASLLGAIGDKRALKPLLGELKSQDYLMRSCAAEALGDLGDREAVPPLIEALNDPGESPWVPPGSSRQDQQKVTQELTRFTSAGVRTKAIIALARLRDPRALAPISGQAGHPDPDVRSKVAFALGHFVGPKSVSTLISMLQDKEFFVRAEAAGSLSAVGDATAIPPLLGLLRDPDARVRRNAIGALGSIREMREIQSMIQALGDPQDEVRQQAAANLRAFGRQDFGLDKARWAQWWQERMKVWKKPSPAEETRRVEGLIATLADGDAEVQKSAANALKALTGQDFGPDRAQWQQWWEANKKTWKTSRDKFGTDPQSW